jgi:hypothetical protein
LKGTSPPVRCYASTGRVFQVPDETVAKRTAASGTPQMCFDGLAGGAVVISSGSRTSSQSAQEA